MMGSDKLMPFVVIAWFLAGAVAEVLNNAARRWSVEQLGLHKRGRSLSWLALGFVLRLSMTALVLALAFRHHVVSGVAALIGYWICRWTVMWRLHRSVSSKESQISG